MFESSGFKNLHQKLSKYSACRSDKTLWSLYKYKAGLIFFRPVFHFKICLRFIKINKNLDKASCGSLSLSTRSLLRKDKYF